MRADGLFVGHGAAMVEEIVEGTRGFAKGAIRSLMSALLFDGIQAYLSYAACLGREAVSKRDLEAFQWVRAQGGDYIFSFDNVCEGLGIDPDWLRAGLINASNSQISEWRRFRRTF